jgi:hypothetical protein
MSSTDDIKRLHRALAVAETVAAVARVHAAATALAEEGAAAQDHPLLDEAIAVAHSCERKGGAMLLDGAASVRGIDAKRWRLRARMDDEGFAHALRRSQSWWRSRAQPAAPRAVRDHGAPQACTVVSDWRVDEFGNPTRFVVGVCAKRFKECTDAGGLALELKADLLAEVLERAA